VSAQSRATHPRTTSDIDLVRLCRSGDPAALEALMRRHNRTLFRTARAILRDDAEAEDAVQEAYLQAFRALATFREESSFSTWLIRIVANQALMRRRRHERHAQIFAIDAGGDEPLPAGEMRRVLEARIDALPDLYRTVFVLRAVEELSVEEAAAVLDMPEATVRTRFFRARALLRAALANDVDHALEDVFGFAGERCDRIVERVLATLQAQRGR
jgi:RNA polymerase sigma-70 factor (ECF subfamily)